MEQETPPVATGEFTIKGPAAASVAAVAVAVPTAQSPTPAQTQTAVVSAGQRKVNLIWEYTQAVIAVVVVTATMGAGLYSVFSKSAEQIPNIIAAAFGMVVGSYFQRTNHMNIGGVGAKPQQDYEGR